MSHVPTNGIDELYRNVIEEVITQSREAFLDENIDVEILFQIKEAWKQKINASGAVDLNQRAVYTAAMQPRVSQAQRVPVQQQQVQQAQSYQVQPQQLQQQQIQPGQMIQPGVSQFLQQQVQTSSYQVQPQQIAQQQIQPQQLIQQQFLQQQAYLPSGLVDLVRNVPYQAHGTSDAPYQVDGEAPQLEETFEDAAVEFDPASGTLTIDATKVVPDKDQDRKETKKSRNRRQPRILAKSSAKAKPSLPEKERRRLARKIPQVDGNPNISESSSDEDEEDQLSHMAAATIDQADDTIEGDDLADEEPLNSADDQSDDEDLDTLFESPNVIVCQFEKVNRTRSKWKFTLKDGIMHLDGKDYCFQKCTGEAEW